MKFKKKILNLIFNFIMVNALYSLPVTEKTRSSQFMLIFVILLLCILLIVFIKKIRSHSRRVIYKTDTFIPAHLWFYSKLIDIEIGSSPATSKNVMVLFYKFLQRLYKISEKDFQQKTIFELVKAKENNSEILDFYGDLYNEINDLSENDPKEVLIYVKKIKNLFNKEDNSLWIEQRKKECNNC